MTILEKTQVATDQSAAESACSDFSPLAQRIADELFTDGSLHTASRLVMEMPNGKLGGGWCRDAVVALVDRIMDSRRVVAVGWNDDGQTEVTVEGVIEPVCSKDRMIYVKG